MNGMFWCNELLYTKIMLEMKVHIDDTGVQFLCYIIAKDYKFNTNR